MPQLLDLPSELLLALPVYLRNIENFVNTASTCRTLRNIFAATHPNTILRLAAASAPTFFSPHPDVLILATARKVADWANGNPERTAELRTAFQGGMDGLLGLAIRRSGLTLAEIRQLHDTRLDVMNVLADKIDKMAGLDWNATPNFWNGGVSEAFTVCADGSAAAYKIAIYGELFGPAILSSLKHGLEGEPAPHAGFHRETRMDFVRYCNPQEWALTSTSPTAAGLHPILPASVRFRNPMLQGHFELRYVLHCGRWRRMWDTVMLQVGAPFEESWRQVLWKNVVQMRGLEALNLVTVDADSEGNVKDAAISRLLELRGQVEALQEPPFQHPVLRMELGLCQLSRP